MGFRNVVNRARRAPVAAALTVLVTGLVLAPFAVAQPSGASVVTVQVPNGATPPTANEFACWSSGVAATCTLGASTTGIVGLVVLPGQASGYSSVMQLGISACAFDGGSGPTVGDYVVLSTSAGGKCHDTGGAGYPVGTQPLGIVTAVGSTATYVLVQINPANTDLTGNIHLSGLGGGASATSSVPGSAGASVSASGGTGGAGSASSSNGGAGGAVSVQGGVGGASTLATGGAGGTVTVQGGAGGTGSAGGAYGNVILAASGGSVGIGTGSPTKLLSVGSGSLFTVDSSGNVVGATLNVSGGSWAASPSLTTPAISNPAITGGGSWAGSPTITNPTIANSAGANVHFPGAPASGADSLVQQSGAGIYYVDTSSSTTTYTVTIANYSGNSNGSWFYFTPNNSNSGAATLQVNSLTAAAIVKFWDQPLVANDLIGGVTYLVLYNTTNGFEVLSASQKIRIPATRFSMYDVSDPTKVVTYSASGITTGNTRQVSWPDASGTVPLCNLNVVTLSATPTLGTANGSVQSLSVTSATTTLAPAIASGTFQGQIFTFYMANNSSSLSFTYPSNMKNGLFGASPGVGSYVQDFFWNGTNWIGKSETSF